MLMLMIFHPPEKKNSLLGKLSCEGRKKMLAQVASVFFLYPKRFPNREFLP
jgi:hypothetical protein